MMTAWFLALLAQDAIASEVAVTAENTAHVAVSGEKETIKRGRTVEFSKLAAGEHAIDVEVDGDVVYRARLFLPDEVEVALSWDGAQLVLTDAVSVSKGGKLARVAQGAMTAGALASQAQATAGDLQDAKSDFQAVSDGTATESSHTEVNVSVGPDGISSSSSRTTIGADGQMDHHAQSTHVGPDGVSRSTASGQADLMSGTSSSASRSVQIRSLPSGVSVSLEPLPLEATAAVSTAVSASAAVAPAPQSAPKPEKVDPDHTNFYAAPAVSQDGAIVSFADPIARMEFAKMSVRLRAPSNRFLVFHGAHSRADFGDGARAPSGRDRVKTVEPGGKGKQTLSFDGGAGFHVDRWTLDLDAAVMLVETSGATLAPGTFTLPASSNTLNVGGVVCTLGKVKKETKETKAAFSCGNGGDGYVLVDPGRVGVRVEGSQTYASSGKHSAELLVPGGETKFTLVFKVPAKVTDMQFATLEFDWRDAFQSVDAAPLAPGELVFELDAARTAEEN